MDSKKNGKGGERMRAKRKERKMKAGAEEEMNAVIFRTPG